MEKLEKDLLTKIVEVAQDLGSNEEFIDFVLCTVAKKFNLNLGNNALQTAEAIREFEYRGGTGFDCGWTSMTVRSKNKELIKQIKKNRLENKFECASIYVGPVISDVDQSYGFEFFLPQEYSVYGQSITIKSIINQLFVHEINKQIPGFKNMVFINSVLD